MPAEASDASLHGRGPQQAPLGPHHLVQHRSGRCVSVGTQNIEQVLNNELITPGKNSKLYNEGKNTSIPFDSAVKCKCYLFA